MNKEEQRKILKKLRGVENKKISLKKLREIEELEGVYSENCGQSGLYNDCLLFTITFGAEEFEVYLKKTY